jgi:hypothetical protein
MRGADEVLRLVFESVGDHVINRAQAVAADPALWRGLLEPSRHFVEHSRRLRVCQQCVREQRELAVMLLAIKRVEGSQLTCGQRQGVPVRERWGPCRRRREVQLLRRDLAGACTATRACRLELRAGEQLGGGGSQASRDA